MQKIKIFKSKKAQIPAINEIVLTILHTTPKPILFFIFILLTSVIAGLMMPAILNMFGYDCAYKGSNLVLLQVPANNILNSITGNFQQTLNTFFGLKQYELPANAFPNGDKRYITVPNDCFQTVTFNGTQTTGYRSDCTNCTDTSGFFQFLTPNKRQICISSGYYTDNSIGWNPQTINFCAICRPPPGYYFDISRCSVNSSCVFTIINESQIPLVSAQYFVNQNYYNTLISLGAMEKAQNSKEFVNLQCTALHRPEVYFFNIRVFDAKLWIYLYISYWVLVFAGWYYAHVGLHF